MAYISQDDKKTLAPGIKAVLKKFGMKGTIAIDNHSSLVVNVSKGPIDFGRDRIQVNQYTIDRSYEGPAREFLNELVVAMKGDKWYDRSDAMTDYFDTAYYLSIRIGKWSKPYEIV
jgi:hypothetical protein